MKTILVFDTETTNLPLWKEPSDHPDQPHITQLAAVLQVEETREVLGSINLLIKPAGWTISEEAARLTGITTEKCEKYGVPIDYALHAFLELWKLSDIRIAHNRTFDDRMIRIEAMRHPHYSMQMVGDLPFADYWKEAPGYCTMTSSTSIVKAPAQNGRGGYKWPTLAEAYKHFTGRDLNGAHNAMIDVEGCLEVYHGILLHEAQTAA